MSTLTKKHFEETAAIIRKIRNIRTRNTEMEKAITLFLNSNARFDQEKFRQLCTTTTNNTSGAKSKLALTLPPDVSYIFKVDVDTSRWWPTDIMDQWDNIHAVTYKGVKYVIDSDECRWTRYYNKNHIWKGQHELSGIDVRHVFEQFTGMKGQYGCGKIGGEGPGGYAPDYTVKDFISDFLFNVKYAEEVSACTAYQVCMTYEVKIENRAKFEKSLAFISNIIRNVKFEFTKDQPKED